MKRFTLVAISGLALAVAGVGAAAAFAADGPRHDLTRAEAQAKAEKLFDRLDANHDGKLDAADRAAQLSAHFDMIDTNHDGQISRDEFLAAHMRGMMGPGHDGMGPEHGGHDRDHADRDHDDHDHRGPGMGMMGGEKEGHGEWGHSPRHALLLFAILHRADPQHTGTVSREAFVNAALSMFDQADANHDGKLTEAERKAAWAAAREHMRHGEHDRDHLQGRGPGDVPPAHP